MGVLDDAIREHIELKRKHGANASELDRQQHEALGPARREAPAQPEEGEDAMADGADVVPLEADVPSEAVPPLESVPEPVAEVPEREPVTEIFDSPVAEPEEFQEPAAPDAPEFAPSEPPRGEDEALPAEPAETEDVLEETPEFLQETPEHDRLWFEQKPPRDFDFDEDDR